MIRLSGFDLRKKNKYSTESNELEHLFKEQISLYRQTMLKYVQETQYSNKFKWQEFCF